MSLPENSLVLTSKKSLEFENTQPVHEEVHSPEGSEMVPFASGKVSDQITVCALALMLNTKHTKKTTKE